jgi:glutaredoxin
MKQPNIFVYGSRHCSETTRALRLLDSHRISYEFKDLDQSPELNGYVASLNNGKRVLPAIQIDNEILISPSDSELGSAVQQAVAERP